MSRSKRFSDGIFSIKSANPFLFVFDGGALKYAQFDYGGAVAQLFPDGRLTIGGRVIDPYDLPTSGQRELDLA